MAVRLEHPTWRHWHQFRRIDWTLTVLVMQVILFLLLGAITTICIPAVIFNAAPWVGWRIFESGRSEDADIRAIVWLSFWVFGVLGPVTGAWLTAGFSHLRRWKVWAFWAGLMFLLQVVLALYFIVSSSEADAFPVRLQETLLSERLMIAALFLGPGGLVLTAMMMTALLGIPLGKAWMWLGRSMRSARWRWRRKLRKQSRTA